MFTCLSFVSINDVLLTVSFVMFSVVVISLSSIFILTKVLVVIDKCWRV